MTLEEAITRYKNNAEYERTHGNLQGCLDFRQLAEWLRELKEYKGQQPCEDCISREMAMKECYTIHDDYGERFDVVQLETLEGLPSVTPARAEGKWIEHKNAEEAPSGYLISNYECSKCHDWVDSDFDYCPNCGSYNGGQCNVNE